MGVVGKKFARRYYDENTLCFIVIRILSIGKNTFIFTHTSNDTHLSSQSKLLSDAAPTFVIARRTSSDEAIHNKNKLAIFSSPVDIGEVRRGVINSDTANQHSPSLSLPIQQGGNSRTNLVQLVSVCFITDAGNCAGGEYGGANTPDNSSGGTPGGGGSSGGDNGNGDDPEWELDNKERCNKEGYVTTSCNSVENPVNYCPYDNTYFEKCVCKPGLVTCTKPYYGVGESCGGKYASCKLDNPRACREDGYTKTGSCNSVQNINRRCPYDANYFDKCVCRSDLYTCSSPLQGVGTACGGKYKSCQCPSSYKSCSCGKASGASSCTWGGTTKYSSCKACCSDTCPSGSKSVSCSSSQNKVKVSTTECGTACYQCQTISSSSSGGSGASCFASFNGGFYHGFCCDDVGSYCGGFSQCYNHFGAGNPNAYGGKFHDPNCSEVKSACQRCGGTLNYKGCGNYGYDTRLSCEF